MSNKNKAALHGLTKKDRKKLERREAELRAELARREAKATEKAAAKKAKKKGGKKAAPADDSKRAEVQAAVADARAARQGGTKEDAKKAAADAKAARKAAREARATDAEERAKPKDAEAMQAAVTADTDAAIKARVQSKKAAREALQAEAETIDRADADAVRDYNTRAVGLGLTLLTSDEEKAATKKKLGKPSAKSDVDKGGLVAAAEAHAEKKAKKRGDDDEESPVYSEEEKAEIRRAVEASAAAEPPQAAEIVETDRGREFAVGASVAEEEFGVPSEAPLPLEGRTNGNGQYKIVGPDGKERGYTRVTTYIGCLEDQTMLMKWKSRILLEGVAAIDDLVATGEMLADESVVSRVREFVHRRDVKIAKARKNDRKGRLGFGQLEAITSAAWSEFKKALDDLVDAAFEIGGGREKAAKGTDIHALCALAVAEGIDAVGAKLEAGEITPADLADVGAFLAALDKLGARVVAVEKVVVIDDRKVAGRLDYILLVKLPGMQRATRLVADLKTGRVDLGAGKIAMQLDNYAEGQGYDDLNPSADREDLKLSRTKALLFHLPAGSGKVTVHIVDLVAGRRGNKLAAEVRAWRNEGKKAIDLKTDLLTVEA